MNSVVITEFNYQSHDIQIGALIDDSKRCKELRIQPNDTISILDNIYMAKVENIVPNIDAAFVMIQPGIRCYLPLNKIKKPLYSSNRSGTKSLRVGDELLVQISRDAMKGKLPAVSTDLSIRGKYFVFTTDSTEIGYSSKLSKEEKQRLSALVLGLMPEQREYGLIVRTNAAVSGDQELMEEFQILKKQIENILEFGPHRICFSCIYEPGSFYKSLLEGIHLNEIEKIVTDKKTVYDGVKEMIGEKVTVCYYEDRLLPLYKLYNLESELNEIYHEKVWLKSGGFLVIQQTEAFVSIDVNSGKYLSKKNAEEGYFKINLEAAREIARQLRLRNLSGMILIDFINMSDPSHLEELFKALQYDLKKDPIRTTAVDITALNILEVTRKKVRRPLIEDLKMLKEQ